MKVEHFKHFDKIPALNLDFKAWLIWYVTMGKNMIPVGPEEVVKSLKRMEFKK